MFPSRFRQLAATLQPHRDASTSIFKAKKQWPPDFSKLAPKHQLRLERRYKRRTKLKWMRPGWVKAMTLAQWGSIAVALAYGILFMDWGEEVTPIKRMRQWFWQEVEATTSLSSPSSTDSPPKVEVPASPGRR
ncbi:MAG: cytosolic leucyl tRNA synthetase [Watsoniomyces obsoletus]|nr:MAG: cytosolic leucyl tRNA synthetase [Watsoniomyces obsoletus]